MRFEFRATKIEEYNIVVEDEESYFEAEEKAWDILDDKVLAKEAPSCVEWRMELA